jgi:VanZ family protein
MLMLSGFRSVLDALFRWPVLMGWMALIFALSSIPNRIVAAEGSLPVDKAAHVVEFGVLSAIITWMAARRTRTAQAMAIGVAGSVLYGLTDELHQALVPGRDPALDDLLADIAGAAAGALAAALLLRVSAPEPGVVSQS